ncbi:MAG: trigger factor [Lentisphaerae bacterium]|nr:trigger factor [Lentisphaerota bacterium]
MAKQTLSQALLLAVTEDGALCRNCEFTVAADRMKAETSVAAQAFANYVAVPGFRRGKAPEAMIVKRFEGDLKDELKRRFMAAAFERLSDGEKLEVVYCRMPEDSAIELGKEYKFTLRIDLAPQIADFEYKGLEVDVPAAEIDEKELDERVEQYRKMYAEFAEVNEAAVAEDMLKVDYTSDFELAEDAEASLKRQVKAEGTFLWLAEPEYIPGCVAALTGAEAGKEYTFDSVYPADYRDAALAGKTVKYTVKVINVQRRKELTDDELAAKLRLDNIDKLRDMLKSGLQAEAEGKRREAVRTAVYDKISAAVGDFELPQGLLEAETDEALQRKAQEIVKSEADAEEFKKNMEQHRADAKVEASAKLRRELIFRKVAKLENITVAASEVDREIEMMSRYYRKKPAELRALMEKNGAIEALQSEILNNKVWNFVADAVKADK